MKQFLGACIGVKLQDRGPKDRHQEVVIMVEDDGNWHDCVTISNFWLDEAIEQLQTAKSYLEKECKKREWGYERK